MHLMYAADENYWGHTFVSLYSLLTNNRDVAFDVHILADAPNPEFFRNAALFHKLHPAVRVSWLQVPSGSFDEAPVYHYLTKVIYYRLLMGRLLPESVNRVLYIDADTIVRGSLRALLEIDIDDYVLAATPEYVHQPYGPSELPHPTRLGLPDGTPYFNSGVLLINLERWRALDIERACLDYVRQNESVPGRLMLHDQDTLNAVLTGKWKSIGPAYNFMEWTTDPQRLRDFNPDTQLGGHIPPDGPVIAHYAGPRKPWHGPSGHPYDSDYWRYKLRTPYAARSTYLKLRLKNVVNRLPGGPAALERLRSLR